MYQFCPPSAKLVSQKSESRQHLLHLQCLLCGKAAHRALCIGGHLEGNPSCVSSSSLSLSRIPDPTSRNVKLRQPALSLKLYNLSKWCCKWKGICLSIFGDCTITLGYLPNLRHVTCILAHAMQLNDNHFVCAAQQMTTICNLRGSSENMWRRNEAH